MSNKESMIEFIPIFDGSSSLKDVLTSLMADKIFSKMSETDLPRAQTSGYNSTRVPVVPAASGSCKGESCSEQI